MSLEPTKNLRNVENSLRGLIFVVLNEEYGDGWIKRCGVSKDRIEKWQKRKENEKKKQKSGSIEERLIYYSDFYDLKTIISKNWNDFLNVFIDKTTIETFLMILEKYRNSDAHRRELFPYQKYLIAGISGEIRSSITKYHSNKKTGIDCFPRIENVRDNFGNSCTADSVLFCKTKMILRPGDEIEFIVAASDPDDLELEYSISTKPGTWPEIKTKWQKSNTLKYKITKKNISKRLSIEISIRSPREYHADDDRDDFAQFVYSVFPNP